MCTRRRRCQSVGMRSTARHRGASHASSGHAVGTHFRWRVALHAGPTCFPGPQRPGPPHFPALVAVTKQGRRGGVCARRRGRGPVGAGGQCGGQLQGTRLCAPREPLFSLSAFSMAFPKRELNAGAGQQASCGRRCNALLPQSPWLGSTRAQHTLSTRCMLANRCCEGTFTGGDVTGPGGGCCQQGCGCLQVETPSARPARAAPTRKHS